MSIAPAPAFFGSGPVAAEYAWFGGKLVPFAEARLPVMTHGFLYGTAVHESMRGYFDQGKNQLYLFRIPDHMERLHRNARTLKIQFGESAAQLTEILTNLVRVNGLRSDSYIRSVAYKSGPQLGLTLNGPHEFTAVCMPQGRFHADYRPLSVCVSSWRRIEDNAIPARGKINGVYVNSALAMTEALDNGFDDAIFLNENGHVSEGSGMNLFLVRGNTLITPSVSENILEGLTRDTVIELARQEPGLQLEVRPVGRTELYSADEIFFTGTAMEVMPIGSVDHRPIGSGKYPVSDRLRAGYFDIVRGRRKEYHKWLTPVYPD